MAKKLNGKRVAILVAEGFEQVELEKPRDALKDEGAETQIVSPESGKVRAWDETDWGSKFGVDVALDDANPEEYDALLLPGGVMNPDHLRKNPAAVQFVRAFFSSGKPIAAICHAPWTLIEADVVRGCTLTSYPSLQTDLRNAGARWVDEEVVTHQGLVTSRNPDDIPAFNRKMIEEFAEGVHSQRVTSDADRMRASQIMTARPETVTPDTPVREVAQRMKELDVGIIPVVESEDSLRLKGVVTDRDLAMRVLAEGKDGKLTVSDCMTTSVATVARTDTVHQVMNLMKREQVRRIPVTDAEGNLVGIIAQADLVVDYAGLDLERETEVEEVIERISEPARPRGR